MDDKAPAFIAWLWASLASPAPYMISSSVNSSGVVVSTQAAVSNVKGWLLSESFRCALARPWKVEK